MKLFRKAKQPLSAKQEQRAGKIAGAILKRQRQAANYLNTKTKGVTGKCWLWLLILFCALFGSYCFYLLVQVFN